MKHAVKTIIIAAMLAFSPNAFAADTTSVVGGLAVAGLSGWYWQNGKSDAEDEAEAAAAAACAGQPSGTVCQASADYGTERTIGILGILAGGAWAVSGLMDESPDYITPSGLVLDGMTFGYTDTGKVGLQKKWEF